LQLLLLLLHGPTHVLYTSLTLFVGASIKCSCLRNNQFKNKSLTKARKLNRLNTTHITLLFVRPCILYPKSLPSIVILGNPRAISLAMLSHGVTENDDMCTIYCLLRKYIVIPVYLEETGITSLVFRSGFVFLW